MVVHFGLGTFGDIPTGADGELLSHAAAIRHVVAEAVVADELGVAVFAVGEHHRPEFAISTPETVLAGIATATSRMILASGVTVLSSDDPVRVFQRFATLDALSRGRAQAIVGRGSFSESFPLFGFDLADYDVLFEEKLELFAALLQEKPLTWSGTVRAPLKNARVFPKTENGRLDTWIGSGGSPGSIVRAARHGLPLMLAIIGGRPEQFESRVELYHRAAGRFAKPAAAVGMHSPGFVADTDKEATALHWPHYKLFRNRMGALRGWPPIQRAEYDRECAEGSLYVGSPETVARRMATSMSALGVQRFDLVYTAGAQAVDARMRCVELYATEVVPAVEGLLAVEAPASGSK